MHEHTTQISSLKLTAWSLIIPFILEQQKYGSLMPLNRQQVVYAMALTQYRLY